MRSLIAAARGTGVSPVRATLEPNVTDMAGTAMLQAAGNRRNAVPMKTEIVFALHSARRIGLLMCGAVMWSVVCGASQCQDQNQLKGRMPGPSVQPPAYPAFAAVPLDPRLQSAAEQELLTGTKSADPEVRVHAIESLSQVGGAHHAEVIAALSDPEPIVRYGASIAAGQLRINSARDKLLSLAGDPDAAVRVVARYALHRIGDYRFSHELEKLSRDIEPRVRGTTAMVLGMLQDPSALKVLRTMRLDLQATVRQQAAAAMWQLGSEQGLKDLVSYSVSRQADDEMMGLLGLAEPRNKQVIQHVRNGLTSDWPEVNLVAARAMGMLGSDEGYGIALKSAGSVDARERIAAAVALGAIGRNDSQNLLGKLLKDSDPNVRVAAAGAILQLGSDRMPK